MNNLEIHQALIEEPSAFTLKSTHCKVYYNLDIDRLLNDRLHRAGLCIKAFDNLPKYRGRFMWGKTPLDEVSKIQNIFAWYGLAPRVFENVVLPDGRGAQITEFVYNDGGKPNLELAEELIDFYRLKHKKFDIHNIIRNEGQTWVGDKMVDFGGITFAKDYIEMLKERCYTRRGKVLSGAYQNVFLLDIAGSRDVSYRADFMFGKGELFEGKDVLDLGSDLGGMCRFAYNAGANRVFGIDRREKPILAYEITNWLGFWNIDYINAPLPDNKDRIPELTGRDQFDVVLCLAVVNHLKDGYQRYITDFVKPGGLLFFEGHGKKNVDTYIPETEAMLKEHFGKVDYIGVSNDNYVRPVFKCQKGE